MAAVAAFSSSTLPWTWPVARLILLDAVGALALPAARADCCAAEKARAAFWNSTVLPA